ncbi:MAG: hypothetical protein AABO58_15455 [Acidobacteriota bacterium]
MVAAPRPLALRRVWLFFPYGVTATYTAMPVAAMTEEFRELVLAGLRAGGATVRP